MSTADVPACEVCGRERTLQDAYDYDPIQAVLRIPLGWYSADDGEICPECMSRIMGGGR